MAPPPPPPLPDQLKRAGIPLIGGLSLVGTMGCGRVYKEDPEFLGSWNLVQYNYAGYSQSTPYAYTYASEDASCTYFGARDLEIDSLSAGRLVFSYGYIGCYGDVTESFTQPVDIEIPSDGVLILTPSDQGGVLDGETGGDGDGDLYFTCQRDGEFLTCTFSAGSETMRFARPACSADSQCSETELCIARQCVTPTDGDGDGPVPVPVTDTGDTFTETGTDGFGETGP